jgi:hypothetical protein
VSLSFRLPHQNFVHFSPLFHACHMPRPSHSPWLDLPNDIWGWAQIMKFLIVQLPPFSRHLIPLRSKYLTTYNNIYNLILRVKKYFKWTTASHQIITLPTTFALSTSRRTKWKTAVENCNGWGTWL